MVMPKFSQKHYQCDIFGFIVDWGIRAVVSSKWTTDWKGRDMYALGYFHKNSAMRRWFNQ